MFAMNLNVFNTINISDRNISDPCIIFIMFTECYIDVTDRLANFKAPFFVLTYFAMRTAGTLCYFYTISHFSPFENK